MSAPLRTRPTARRRPAPGAPTRVATPAVLTVGVIGAGRVGAALGAALAAAGHRVIAATGDSGASRARLALLLPTVSRRPAASVARAATDLLLIAVPDDALAGVVSGLAADGALRPGQVVAHTSGAHGLAVLAPAAAVGARPLALHPAMTFAGTPDDLDRLPGISYGVTAPAELRPLAARLVADLGGVPEWISEDDRALYHAALAHGANHLVTLVNEAADRLRDAGVGQPEKVLAPLLHAALENALRLGDDALTGPVSRGDAGTVQRHLSRLAVAAPESVAPYLALARRTADRAVAAGRLRPVDAQPLFGVLGRDQTEVAA
ncbi:Predicted oxidoreductase, contains short-chain dehydrogenase (SDR) and DUF2520 domains [Micromonospora phaseoli]|uniref:Predicted oxidoreductase, contains short-chain dehydrogenase (SDR) and DUF2520 domains n=1 Tax=Micromonospora phaseoli TaxID=1144548 RepID=A0A1H7DBT3_9ACTN|nr:Rossmann-like and DUF2520 domain-containing protein [Micromonospora phaseoli]PZV90594.1 putative short-subunit dehydrogenase-like oxidoreductase (DUF2520 family) [Micromonospora phaseoli]GIJ78014.1 hypothetical protein Xph01_24460 [Micromonospora phaseoli]SEJ99299.1 Predicted oxidoreductase, contains short-chain dehydrogenase (SDR) and DUF2520 domains [Micromonospora phaseoli]